MTPKEAFGLAAAPERLASADGETLSAALYALADERDRAQRAMARISQQQRLNLDDEVKRLRAEAGR